MAEEADICLDEEVEEQFGLVGALKRNVCCEDHMVCVVCFCVMM